MINLLNNWSSRISIVTTIQSL